MKYAIAAILGAFAVLMSFIFGKRPRVLDNGSGADRVRDGLRDSQDRADDIADKVGDATGTAIELAGHIDTASAGVDQALDIVRSIRRRGAQKPVDTDLGTSGD